jgi:hypothetical protein
MIKLNYISKLVALLPLVLGAVSFFVVVGPRALRPTNIGWLGAGDPATNYVGWQFFRQSDWSFPIGLNPKYGLELSNAIIFSDSNPLFAFLFKPFSAFLPEPFQYFGIWLLVCFVLQAWFGWKLMGLISQDPTIRILGSGFFVFAPPMIWRLHGHYSLVGHFIVLAGLYLSLRPLAHRNVPAWAALLALAALVHAYLLAMVAALWAADLLQMTVRRDRSLSQAAREVAVIMASVGLACWQAGYFTVGAGAISSGYGFYRMNLLSPVDPSGWSYVLKDIPEAKGEYEGFNFFGLGVIVLAIMTLPVLLRAPSRLWEIMVERWALVILMLAFWVYALSHHIGVGALQFEFPLPTSVEQVANIFRSSGRMFWPVFYVVLLTLIFLVVRGNSTKVAIGLLGLVLVVQVADTKATWGELRRKLMHKPATEWVSPLNSPFWEEAAKRYQKVRWIVPGNLTPHWQTLAAYAASQNMATDAVYLSRVGHRELEGAQSKALHTLATGKYDADSLFVLDPAHIRLAAQRLDAARDLLAKVDGFYVIAPGWKVCADCPAVGGAVSLHDVVPPIDVGARIAFSQTDNGALYLGQGWSSPEEWGTWSDGPTAEIVIPIGSGLVSRILVEAGALISPEHPVQNVSTTVNGVLLKGHEISMPSGNVLEIDLPDKARTRIESDAVLRLRFAFPNAISPTAIGMSNDPRHLALGLAAISLE